MQDSAQGNNQVKLNPWKPNKLLRRYDPLEVRYSCGFLRCSPEKWFPGFAMQWQPLAHSLGVEFSLVETKPFIGGNHNFQYGFTGSIDDEPMCVFLEDDSAVALLEMIIPGARNKAREVVLEYLAMRLISSLALSWTGPESSLVKFESDIDPHSVRGIGGVKLQLNVNGTPITIWITMGKIMLEKMDGLWRRQLHSTIGTKIAPTNVRVEVGHLTVPPAMLSEYLKSGVFYDIEIPVSDSVTLIANDKAWLPARLGIVNNNFVVATVATTPPSVKIPAGATKLSFEFGITQLVPGMTAEVAQVGASFDTNIRVSDKVSIVVNNEKVGEAILRSYQGSLVISVC